MESESNRNALVFRSLGEHLVQMSVQFAQISWRLQFIAFAATHACWQRAMGWRPERRLRRAGIRWNCCEIPNIVLCRFPHAAFLSSTAALIWLDADTAAEGFSSKNSLLVYLYLDLLTGTSHGMFFLNNCLQTWDLLTDNLTFMWTL